MNFFFSVYSHWRIVMSGLGDDCFAVFNPRVLLANVVNFQFYLPPPPPRQDTTQRYTGTMNLARKRPTKSVCTVQEPCSDCGGVKLENKMTGISLECDFPKKIGTHAIKKPKQTTNRNPKCPKEPKKQNKTKIYLDKTNDVHSPNPKGIHVHVVEGTHNAVFQVKLGGGVGRIWRSGS